TMVTLRLRYVVSDRDRHGNVRYYFRRKGGKKIRLHGIRASKVFMDSYALALGSVTCRPAAGNFEVKSSFGFLCKEYFRSQTFKALNPGTRLWRRRSSFRLAMPSVTSSSNGSDISARKEGSVPMIRCSPKRKSLRARIFPSKRFRSTALRGRTQARCEEYSRTP